MENKQTPAPEQAPEIKEGFFLRRPIFSTVISLIITLVGARSPFQCCPLNSIPT